MTFENGIFTGEPADAYHAKKQFISSSPLVEMAKSPLHFYNAWTETVETTDAMERGTFMHSLILEQDIAKYVARPLKDGRLIATNTKDYAAFLEANLGKTPIHPDLYNDALAILTAACANKTFMKFYINSEVEQSVYGVHKETGLPIKARPDMLAKDQLFILDVKSVADISRFEKQIFSLNYDVRLQHYVETIFAATGRLVPHIYFFAIESKAPYGTKIFKLSAHAVEAAGIKWGAWMNEIAVCKEENKWPGFTDEIIEVDRPAYLDMGDLVFEGAAS